MQILCDVWEGSLDIDEAILREGGVSGLIIRINDISGGHHKDMTFDAQWVQSERFLRAAYFVYNPWSSGDQNFQWLMDNLPGGCKIVFVDIEVKKADYSASVYADEVQRFYDLISAHCHTVIYTGGWFLPFLIHWPKVEYWWARYPWVYYPDAKEHWTWEQLKIKVNSNGWNPDPLKQCAGIVKLWQLSGDRLILPGTAERPMDISVWNGDLPSLEAWWGAELPTAPLSKVDILWREAALHGWNLNG